MAKVYFKHATLLCGLLASLALAWGYPPAHANPQWTELSPLAVAPPAEVKAASAPAATAKQPQYHHAVINPATTVHWVVVPPAQQGWVVLPWASKQGLASVDAIAAELPAAAMVLNGGYFDPANGETASSVWTWDERLLSPDDNERLIGNEALKPYWQAIVNRSQWQVWHCAVTQPLWRYEVGQPMIETVDAPALNAQQPPTANMPSDCSLQAWLGAGPALLPELLATQEAFVDEKAGRNPIGTTTPDARSAVAKLADGSVLLAWVQQNKPTGGMTLVQWQQWLKSQGAEQALNLDGGSSVSAWLGAKVSGTPKPMLHLGKLSAKGVRVKRKVLTGLVVMPLADALKMTQVDSLY